jgi:hypothetical protein
VIGIKENTNMTKKLITLAALFVALASLGFGQASLTVTTLTTALTTGGGSAYSTVVLGSCTNVNNPTLPIAGGPAIGDPSAAPYTYLVIDKEVIKVNNVLSTSPCTVLGERGFTGSFQSAHVAGQMVYVTQPNYLMNVDPVGACTAALARTQPTISYTTGTMWTCTSTGQWAKAFSIDNSQGYASGFQTVESGANNAIVCAKGCGPEAVPGLVVTILLAHSLQAGANTFSYNGTTAVAIKSHLNPANNIATAYVSTGVISMVFSGGIWLDLSQ